MNLMKQLVKLIEVAANTRSRTAAAAANSWPALVNKSLLTHPPRRHHSPQNEYQQYKDNINNKRDLEDEALIILQNKCE